MAAAIIHVTSRRLRQLAHEADPPPCGPTGYDAQAFVDWAMQRAEKGRDLLAERIRLTKAQADKAEIEGAALRDGLLPMADAVAQVTALVAATRERLLRLPSALAKRVADTPPRRVIARAAVRELIDEALAEITVDGFTDAMRGTTRA